MPVIVYKTMTLNILYSRGFRVNCAYCNQPFTYLFTDVHSQQVTGMPVLSSSDGMRKSVGKAASKSMRRLGKSKKKVGKPLCPHCHHFQPWVVSQSRRNWLVGGILLGGAIGTFGTAILANVLGASDEMLGMLVLAMGGGLAILGGFLGWRFALHHRAYPDKQDIKSMNDEDMQEFLVACEQKEADPALAWCLISGRQPGEKTAFFTLGLRDLTGDKDFFPEDTTTDYVLQQMDQ